VDPAGLDDLAHAVEVEVGDRDEAVERAVLPDRVAVEVVGGVAGDDLLDAVGVEVDDRGEVAVAAAAHIAAERGAAVAEQAGADHAAGAVEDRAAEDDLGEAVAVHVGDRRVVVAVGVGAGPGGRWRTTSGRRRGRRARTPSSRWR
jgi:hypothetical protein